jgi:hypothetical protein
MTMVDDLPPVPPVSLVPHRGEGHVWSQWYPFDRRTSYRQCLRWKCPVVETVDVSKA